MSIRIHKTFVFLNLLIISFSFSCLPSNSQVDANKYIPLPDSTYIQDSSIICHTINPKNQNLSFYSKNEKGNFFVNHGGLKKELEKKNLKLKFAMNGGMYNQDLSPQGLYIENGQLITPLDTIKKGYGNFYLQPNGVFYIDKNKEAFVTKTSEFQNNLTIQQATQSGPMLVMNGQLHPAFNKGSSNLHIRNGVGILPNGDLLFAMSKSKINFYDFATFFQQHKCKNALYLDGFVSRTYLPEQNWIQEDGKFAIIIAETEE